MNKQRREVISKILQNYPVGELYKLESTLCSLSRLTKFISIKATLNLIRDAIKINNLGG